MFGLHTALFAKAIDLSINASYQLFLTKRVMYSAKSRPHSPILLPTRAHLRVPGITLIRGLRAHAKAPLARGASLLNLDKIEQRLVLFLQRGVLGSQVVVFVRDLRLLCVLALQVFVFLLLEYSMFVQIVATQDKKTEGHRGTIKRKRVGLWAGKEGLGCTFTIEQTVTTSAKKLSRAA